MIYIPGQAYYSEFTTTNPTTGAAADADSLPVATATRNGTDDAAFILTVTKLDTGRYKITGTVPAGYAAGDWLHVSVSVVMGGIIAKAVVDKSFIDIIFTGHSGTVTLTGRPGTNYYGMFITSAASTGAAVDADALPVATANKNGADDAAFVLTVTKIDTGRYKVTGTIPATYTTYDKVHISAAATVGGVAGKAIVEKLMIDSTPIVATDPKRQQVLDAVKARLQTVLIANGYRTDIGDHVTEWDTVPMDQNVETMLLEYRDEEEDRIDVTVGQQDMVLPVRIRNRTAGSTALAAMRNILADVALAMISVDPTWGGLANDTNQDGPATLDKGQAADTAAAAEIVFKIEYSVDRGTS